MNKRICVTEHAWDRLKERFPVFRSSTRAMLLQFLESGYPRHVKICITTEKRRLVAFRITGIMIWAIVNAEHPQEVLFITFLTEEMADETIRIFRKLKVNAKVPPKSHLFRGRRSRRSGRRVKMWNDRREEDTDG